MDSFVCLVPEWAPGVTLTPETTAFLSASRPTSQIGRDGFERPLTKTAVVWSWQIDKAGGIDELSLVERSRPVPRPHEVLIRVQTVSLNYRDLIIVGGMLGPLPRSAVVPVSDVAGEVVEVGIDAKRFNVGERVIVIFHQR